MSSCAVAARSVVAVINPPESYSDCSDSQLIALVRQGDNEAFAALFRQYKTRVYSLCLQMTGDVSDAEDLTQDAFLQVFRKQDSFRGDSAFSTWLYRVVVNTVRMSFRKRKLQQVSLDDPICLDSSMVKRDFGRRDSRLSGAVDRIVLIRALQKLPEGYRRFFVLHDVEGHHHREIARLLQCSVGNSKSQVHKARLKMRELLQTNKRGRRRRARNNSPSASCESIAGMGKNGRWRKAA